MSNCGQMDSLVSGDTLMLENQPSFPNQKPLQLLRLKDVQNITGLSRSHVYALMKQGIFPGSVPLVPGGTSRAWVHHEVQEWLEQRVAERDQEVA